MNSWVAPDTHGWLHAPASEKDWQSLLERFDALETDPLSRVFEIARANRCRSIIEENRYVDPDFRSEYSAFWSQRFADTPAFARRLHFFRRQLSPDDLHRLPKNSGYIGYSTLKPIGRSSGNGRVGRTMLVPPRRLLRAVLTLATDHVSLFGTPLTVTGAPFYEQDGEFLRCAHVAAWMCHYSASLKGLAGRQLTAELVDMSPSAFTTERDLPSPGLTLNQIQAIFAATGQPALFYGLSKMPVVQGVENPPVQPGPPGYWDTRIFSVLCRYLNAGFPVLIGTYNHAFVIVGWFREGKRIRFIACDDQWGPYETITSPFTDRRAPWQSIMVPLPPKVYLSAESAESAAYLQIRAYGNRKGAPAPWRALSKSLSRKEISLRTFLRSNLAYKEGVLDKQRGADTERILRLARLAHWVWVVEAHDREKRKSGKPSVLAEFVFDSTSNDRLPTPSAITLPPMVATLPPDDGVGDVVLTAKVPWKSQLP